MTKRLEELLQKCRMLAEEFDVSVLHAKQVDDAVKIQVAEFDRIRRDLQTRLEHNVIDPSEATRRHLDARLGVVDARLDRLEDMAVTISKTSAATTSLLMDMLALLTEAVSDG